MGMETALSKPAVASVFMEGLKKFEQIFQEVFLYSGLSPDHAKILSQRMLSIYQEGAELYSIGLTKLNNTE